MELDLSSEFPRSQERILRPEKIRIYITSSIDNSQGYHLGEYDGLTQA